MSADVPEANFEYIPQEQYDLDAELVPETHIFEVELFARDLHYTHEQGIASSVWVIKHNLNKEPSVVVVDTADEEQIPDRKVYNNKNQVTLYFLSEFAGKAYLN
jgi:hypothetical protein